MLRSSSPVPLSSTEGILRLTLGYVTGTSDAATGCRRQPRWAKLVPRHARRTHQPHPDLEPVPPDATAGGLRRLLQRQPSAPRLSQAAPLRPLPDDVIDLDTLRV